MDILFAVTKIFRELVGDDAVPVAMDTSPDDVPDWDSIVQLNLVLMTELEFAIRFATADMATVRTIGDLVRLVERYTGR